MSDLIERYGYERAVRELKAMDDRAIWMISGCLKYREEVRKECLEYRRENNIYEVGDKVVSTLDGDEDWKNAVCEILAFHKKMAITTGFSCAIHHYDYRHATDEEIAAGVRV